MSELFPIFVNLQGRRVLVVGAGPVAASKLDALLAAGADVTVVAPEVHPAIEKVTERRPVPAGPAVTIVRREFAASDLEGVWLVVAAATPGVNRAVAEEAARRFVFVNAVDDPSNATAFLSGVVRRDGVTIGISTSGSAPGLTALMREALDAVLPADLGEWMNEAARQRLVWKRDDVPMANRRPLLLRALNELYRSSALATSGTSDRAASESPHSADPAGPPVSAVSNVAQPALDGSQRARGHVSIVGAGPGDPGLLTRTAVARLRAADLVLYDALVDDRLLRLARRSQRFFVGKRAGRHALSQTGIHAVMIRAARRGRRVVRLKGGDPFVFGRGGEEVLALTEAGVPFDVVPGVTSAVAGPALAGIPVTHRGLSSAFLVVTGHDERGFGEIISTLKPHGVTLVILMGLARRAALASVLMGRGWPAETPAALVAEASLPEQEEWRGSLGDLAMGQAHITSTGPALLVVGDVAALALTAGAGRRIDSAPSVEDSSDDPVHQHDLPRIEQCL